MRRIMNSVVLSKTMLMSLFFIFGLCLGACSHGDEILSYGFSGGDEPSTGHYFGYKVKSKIPVFFDTFEVTLFVGHIPGIKHFFWHTENGRESVTGAERERLDFSIDLYALDDPRHKTIVESFDYLSDEYLANTEIITDPVPEYITPLDWKVVYSSNFKVKLDVNDIIVDKYGEITFYVCQIDMEKGYKESFSATRFYYEIIEDEIVFSYFANPVLEYDASNWKY